jgi:hypothetical protein
VTFDPAIDNSAAFELRQHFAPKVVVLDRLPAFVFQSGGVASAGAVGIDARVRVGLRAHHPFGLHKERT